MRALIVLVVSLLSVPAFGESHMTNTPGFGDNLGFGAPVAPGFDPNRPSFTPPLPREKPEQEAVEAWLKTPEGRAEAERFERELEEWADSPEGLKRRREIEKMLRNSEPERERVRPRGGVDI